MKTRASAKNNAQSQRTTVTGYLFCVVGMLQMLLSIGMRDVWFVSPKTSLFLIGLSFLFIGIAHFRAEEKRYALTRISYGLLALSIILLVYSVITNFVVRVADN
jgi:hypothetical protein